MPTTVRFSAGVSTTSRDDYRVKALADLQEKQLPPEEQLIQRENIEDHLRQAASLLGSLKFGDWIRFEILDRINDRRARLVAVAEQREHDGVLARLACLPEFGGAGYGDLVSVPLDHILAVEAPPE